MNISKNVRAVAAAAVALAVAGGVGTAYATATPSTPTSTDGYTTVTQTRVYDSTHGGALLGGNATATITLPATLVPADADAVNIQLTAASETAVNGDLDVNSVPGTATSNLNFTKGVAITGETTAKLTGDAFTVFNHSSGTVRLVVDVLGYYSATPVVQTVTQTLAPTDPSDSSKPLTVDTGGSFFARATDAGTVDLPAGSYLVTLSIKATPQVQGNTSVVVYPSVHLYDQVKNAAFTGDLLDTGGSPLESGTVTNADLFASNSGVVTLAQDTTLHLYAFGYDSDSGEGTYTLDSVTVTATPINVTGN